MSSPQHADKRRATAEMASADKEASQGQSEIPNRQHWNNDRKRREVAEMLKRRQVEIKQEKLEKATNFTTAEHQRQEMELVSSYTANGKTRSGK